MNKIQIALIKKDMRSVTSNKNLFMVMLIIPLVMAVVLPSIFILVTHFAPDDLNGMDAMLAMLPKQTDTLERAIMGMLLDSVMPMFFLLIPIMAASVMAASSFVGEKEKRTLETLLYSPLTLGQVFQAKILASFFMSMLVSFVSIAAMLVVVEVEILLTTGSVLLPGISWLVIILLIAPSISMVAIILIVRGSAKAQTMEESQQRAVFLIMPIILLAVGQFTGLILINIWLLLGLGIALVAAALLLLRSSVGKINYETVLK